MELSLIIIGVVDIRPGSNGDKHLLSVQGKPDIASPMPSPTQPAATRQISDVLLRSARFQVAIRIRKAQDRIRITHIDPLRVRAWGIKRYSEGLSEACGEGGDLLGLARAVDAAKDFDLSAPTLGKKDVSIGGRSKEAWVVEPIGVKLDFEARRRDRQSTLGPGHNIRPVIDRIRSIRSGEVGNADVMRGAGLFSGIADERGIIRYGLLTKSQKGCRAQ
jgi:hypothetical protein